MLMNRSIYCTWQNIRGVKFWQMYACQTFGGNKLVNHLCSTFEIIYFQRQRLNFGELTIIYQIHQYFIPPIFCHVWYRTCIKFCGLNFCVFGWQENSWDINFHGHGSVVSTIIVGINFHGVQIFVDKRIP